MSQEHVSDPSLAVFQESIFTWLGCCMWFLLAFWLCEQQTHNAKWITQCVQEKRKPINQVNFFQNYNDLSKKVYIVTKFSLSSFFWHQTQDVLAMHGQARTISNGDVKTDLRRIGGYGLNKVCHVSEQRDVLKRSSLAFLLSLWSCFSA